MPNIVDHEHYIGVAECIARRIDRGFVICLSETTHGRAEGIRDALYQLRPDVSVTIIANRDFAGWVRSTCRVLIADIHALGVIDLGPRTISAVCVATRPTMADGQTETMIRLLSPAADGTAPELVGPYLSYVGYVCRMIANYQRLHGPNKAA